MDKKNVQFQNSKKLSHQKFQYFFTCEGNFFEVFFTEFSTLCSISLIFITATMNL